MILLQIERGAPESSVDQKTRRLGRIRETSLAWRRPQDAPSIQQQSQVLYFKTAYAADPRVGIHNIKLPRVSLACTLLGRCTGHVWSSSGTSGDLMHLNMNFSFPHPLIRKRNSGHPTTRFVYTDTALTRNPDQVCRADWRRRRNPPLGMRDGGLPLFRVRRRSCGFTVKKKPRPIHPHDDSSACETE